jgi:hypothetical protein
MEILVFKTNISQREDVQKVKTYLNKHKSIIAWNVDTEDSDRVLRVVASADITQTVESLVSTAGYYIEELT